MMVLRYLQMDVFAARPGMGNALGAVIDGARFDPARMQAFAAWTNLSETIFLLPPTTPEADYRVRIFTPVSELPFAGHPSVGAAWAVAAADLVPADRDTLVQECAAGLLPVRIDNTHGDRRPAVRAPRAVVVGGRELAPAALDAVTAGLRIGEVAPTLWCNGPRWWVLALADGAAVRGLTPDLAAIATLTRATDAVGLTVYAPEHGGTGADAHDLVVRAFCPADGIPEDPVTGSAQACIAAQLAAHGHLPNTDGRYVGSQGRELGRDGRVEVQVDAAGDVWIGGQVQPVIDGTVVW